MKKRNKHIVQGILAFLYIFSGFLPVEAATEQEKANGNKPPVVIEADHLYFSDATGEFFAQGNAVVVQNEDKIIADKIRGNSKQTMIWVDDSASFSQTNDKTNVNLTGHNIIYDYKQQSGTIAAAQGTVQGSTNKAYIKGQNLQVASNKMVVHQGWITGCPAIKPDYHVTADKIEIWPGDKLIAYNASFYIKGRRIYTLPKYSKSLNDNDKGEFPRLGYSSDDGLMIAQYLEYPLSNRTSVFADAVYYTKRGFEPSYGVINRMPGYTLQFGAVRESNSDDEWITKEPEFSLTTDPIKLGNTPLTAKILLSAGKWKEEAVAGWRQSYGLSLNHAPIKLADNVTLNFGMGYQGIHYAYNDTTNHIWSYRVMVQGESKKLDWWTGYIHNNESGDSPYVYDDIETPRELTAGFIYKLDSKNGLGVNAVYDMSTDKIKDVDYIWRRDLHCWKADITYREKRNEWRVKLHTVEW